MTGDEVQVVTFRVGNHDFACNVFQVERILRYETPSALPNAPAFLEGIVSYGGSALPVIDLRKRLNVEAPVRDETRTVVVEWENGRVGVVVDAVLEVLKVGAERIAAPPAIVRGLAAKYIAGILTTGDRTVVVLSPSELLSSQEQLQLEMVASEALHD